MPLKDRNQSTRENTEAPSLAICGDHEVYHEVASPVAQICQQVLRCQYGDDMSQNDPEEILNSSEIEPFFKMTDAS